jgi:glyceraldehyde-3-phosphate dehydrogenase (ferredoxin)
MKSELMLDNSGMCRFHRAWAEGMLPEIIGSLYGMKERFGDQIAITASRINSRNASVFWESQRSIDFIHCFLKRQRATTDGDNGELAKWIERFDRDKREAALDFWYDMHKGINESLKEF